MTSDIRIGQKLRMLREIRNLKQDTIAEKLGISQNAYSRLELNQTKLSVEQAEKLASIFEVSLPDLLSKENPIISFTYQDSVTLDNSPGYINHNHRYSGSKEVIDVIVKSKDDEIAALKEQIKNQQDQINNLTSFLGEYIKGVKK